MECPCGGILSKGKSNYSVSGQHFYFMIEDIPAYKCNRCGKILFEDEVVDKIKALVKRIERETKEIVTGMPSIHIYDY